MSAEQPSEEPKGQSVPDPEEPGATAVPSTGKNPLPKPGHLPMTELLFDKQGPASPFGEDVQFPLPPESLPYTHPGSEH